MGKDKDKDGDVIPIGQKNQTDEERLEEYLDETTAPEKPGT